jgi:molybdopterin-guanine dinucleotide biosynthesis protein A
MVDASISAAAPGHAALLGVVLAGGKSSRMGRNKALLDLQGRSLLEHQMALLAPLCARVVVSGAVDGVEGIPDDCAHQGPLGGILTVAKRFPGWALLLIPVDMPRLETIDLQQLCSQAASCHFSGQPLPAFFPDSRELIRVLEAIFDQSQHNPSMQRLHAVMGSKALPWSGFNALNLNTPEQWQAFLMTDKK